VPRGHWNGFYLHCLLWVTANRLVVGQRIVFSLIGPIDVKVHIRPRRVLPVLVHTANLLSERFYIILVVFAVSWSEQELGFDPESKEFVEHHEEWMRDVAESSDGETASRGYLQIFPRGARYGIRWVHSTDGEAHGLGQHDTYYGPG